MAGNAGPEHHYDISVRWTGNRGEGTASYRAYGRDHQIQAGGKPGIDGSSDPAFRGDASRYNPEELFLAAVSACHMLTYLHLCAGAGVVVTSYEDEAGGTMVEDADWGGRFSAIVLRPRISLAAAADRERAKALHADAHRLCFIASSLSVPVLHEPTIIEAAP